MSEKTTLEVFTEKVLQELKAQDEKWGKNREKHPLEWFAILSEETGEIAKEYCDNSFASTLGSNYETELIQATAVLFRMYQQNRINLFGKSFQKEY